MSQKKAVKIVKRSERAQRKPANVPANVKAPRKTASDMVNTVASWVSEFQERQRAETTKAIDNLIRSRQQPNEA